MKRSVLRWSLVVGAGMVLGAATGALIAWPILDPEDIGSKVVLAVGGVMTLSAVWLTSMALIDTHFPKPKTAPAPNIQINGPASFPTRAAVVAAMKAQLGMTLATQQGVPKTGTAVHHFGNPAAAPKKAEALQEVEQLIIGYRAFKLDFSTANWPLQSLHHNGNWWMREMHGLCFKYEEVTENAQQRCERHLAEGRPFSDCGCGLYAYRTPEWLWGHEDAALVWGAVRLEGVVLIHKEGFRASKATIEQLWVDRSACVPEFDVVAKLKQCYGVPVEIADWGGFDEATHSSSSYVGRTLQQIKRTQPAKNFGPSQPRDSRGRWVKRG